MFAVNFLFIFRLLTSGTIEEKIYHRQIFKQFLTNRVLKDPKQQRFFKTNDLYELFTLNEGDKEKTESSAIFAGTGSEIKVDVDREGKDSDEEAKPKLKRPDEKVKGTSAASKNGQSNKSSKTSLSERESKPKKTQIVSTTKNELPHKGSSRKNKSQHKDSGQKNKSPHKDSGQINEISSVEAKFQERMRKLAKQISMNIAKKSSSSESKCDSQIADTSIPKKVDSGEDTTICTGETRSDDEKEKSSSPILPVNVSDIKQKEREGEVSEVTVSEECRLHKENEDCDNPTYIKKEPESGDESSCMEGGLGYSICDIKEENIHAENCDVKMELDIVKEEFRFGTNESPFAETKNAPSTLLAKREIGRENNSDSGNCSFSSKELDISESKYPEKHRKKHKKKDKHREKKERHKDNKEGHKDKPHKKGKKLDGERIDYLVKKRMYHKTEEEEKAEKENAKSQDEYVLSKLFQKSGVHTALSHDSIMSNGDADYLLMEGEAERVAKEALKAVRASRARCLRPWAPSDAAASESKKSKPKFGKKKNQIFTDSVDREIKKDQEQKPKKSKERMFNGGLDDDDDDSDSASGVSFFAKKTKKKSPDGLSSAQLLSRIHQRNKTVASLQLTNDDDEDEDYDPDYPSTARATEAEEPVDEDVQENIDLLADIRNFVAFQAEVDGSAATKEILDRFRTRLPPEQTPFFKALLTKICDFHRKSSGEGMWSLKEEFR